MDSRLVLTSMVVWQLFLHPHPDGQAVYQHYSAMTPHQTPAQSTSLLLVDRPHLRFLSSNSSVQLPQVEVEH